MLGQPEQHVNEGCCKFCGARLSLVKRMSRQEFCSQEHRDEFQRSHGDAALGRLQETARPKPSTASGPAPGQSENTRSAPVKPSGSILGLSAPPPEAASQPPAPRAAVNARPPAPEPARPAAPPPQSKTPPPAMRTASAPPAAAASASQAPAQSMALARTRQRPKQAVRGGQLDPALSRLMEASSSTQEAPVRAPMRFGPERFAPQPAPDPEPEFVRPASAESPAQTAAPAAAPLAASAPAGSEPAASASAANPPSAREPEPEVEMMTVERRGARPPASFVLTGQLAYGERSPRHDDSPADSPWEPVVLTPLSLPANRFDPGETGMLKIDGERVPGTVDQVRPVAGDLMTILVVRAAPSLLPGLMELPRGPEAEPEDWKAFAAWVREKIRQQDGPDPADLVELPEPEPRAIAGAFVQALFGSDRFWPNPKTYVVYPTRELVRRPLLQHADLPVEQDTVPLLVSRGYEAAHRRIMAEWNPADSETAVPQGGALPVQAEAHPGASNLHHASTQPTSIQALSVLPQTGLAPGGGLDAGPEQFPEAGSAAQPTAATPASSQTPRTAHAPARPNASHGPVFPSMTRPPVLPGAWQPAPAGRANGQDAPHIDLASGVPTPLPEFAGGQAESGAYGPTLRGREEPLPVEVDAAAAGFAGGPPAEVSMGGLSSGIVLPRLGMRSLSGESRPLVVLYCQPPTAKMVTLDLDPADRPADPAQAPPIDAADIQPEIRQTPSGRPLGRLSFSLRLQTMVGLEGNERDADSPLRGDEESMAWSWLGVPRPSAPTASFTVRRARVPVPRTAVRLAGADRAPELFLSPTPVEFTATVDQWSAL